MYFNVFFWFPLSWPESVHFVSVVKICEMTDYYSGPTVKRKMSRNKKNPVLQYKNLLKQTV